MKKHVAKWAGVLAVAGLLVSGCGGNADEASAKKGGEVHVFAASSLNSFLKDVKPVYESEHSGQTLTINAAGTQVLKALIDQGAPADLLLAARQKDVDSLKQSGNVESSERLAANEMVVIVSKEGAAKIRSLEDLAKKDVKLVVGEANSPIGEYSRKVLKKLDESGKFGAGYADKVLANILSNESNEQSVLAKVTLGEADAGLVYRTSFMDVGKDKGMTMLVIPEAYNMRSDYHLVVLKGASNEGKVLAKWLMSDKGKELLKNTGSFYKTIRCPRGSTTWVPF